MKIFKKILGVVFCALIVVGMFMLISKSFGGYADRDAWRDAKEIQTAQQDEKEHP